MSYADARDYFFDGAMTLARHLLDPTVIPAQVAALITDLNSYGSAPGQVLRERIRQNATSFRGHYGSRKALARTVLLDALAWIGEELDSEHVSGGSVINESGVFFDFRKRLVADTHYINARANSYEANPAPGNGMILRRLTVDHLNKAIEGGRHGSDDYAEVVLSQLVGGGVGRARVLLKGSDGPEDELDYQSKGTARDADVFLDFYGDTFPGAVVNSTFKVTGNPSAGATVDSTNLPTWEQSNVAGSPTVTFETATPWRNQTGFLRIGGLNTTKRYRQRLVLPNGSGPYRPVDFLAVLRRDANWTGTVTITIGNLTKSFTQADMTTDVLFYGLPTLDDDLYPVNFDTGAVYAQIDVNTTHATGKIDLFYLDVQQMTARQGLWHSAWNWTTDPTIGFVHTFDDTCTYGGETQDTICVAFDEEPYAYLPTSGAVLITSVG